MLTYLLTIAILAVATLILAEQWKSRVLTRQNWDDLIETFQPIDTSEIMAIALEYLNPEQLAVRTDPIGRLAALGGIKGVKQMRRNGNLLIALAAQAERWNPEATRTLVAQMRRDGSELRRATFWVLLHLLNVRHAMASAYVQRAAAAYYRMISRLLDATRECSPNELASLNKAIWDQV